MTKKIPLTQGLQATVSARDYPRLTKYRWHAHKDGHAKTFYALRHYRLPSGKPARRSMHTEILGLLQVDHKNGDGLDNRRSNLRPATGSQNMHNQGLRRNNTSGVKGVTWCPPAAKWMARISVNYTRVYLGLFAKLEDAREAYSKAAKHYFGKYSRT